MLEGKKKITVVMPAYNAEKTLKKSIKDLPSIVDNIVIVDDYSNDKTVSLAVTLAKKDKKIHFLKHTQNKGYGANQKTCYKKALELKSDIIIMVHPDYQYSPKLAGAMAAMIASGHYDVVLASRILGRQLGPNEGGMPKWRWFSNRILTLVQNILCDNKMSEYHTGYRAFSSEVLQKLPLSKNSDDFVFDNQMLVQVMYYGFRMGEISCPTRYFEEASSINLKRSIVYGLGVVKSSLDYYLAVRGKKKVIYLPGKPIKPKPLD